MCRLFSMMFLLFPLTLFASTAVKSMVIFGDSLSDTGNVTHLLKSLRQEESAAFLVRPFKVFVINKMIEFADEHYVPDVILDAGIDLVTHFFDQDLGPLLASIVTKVNKVPVLPGEPYWESRFSNGRVWNEYLAPMLSIDPVSKKAYNNQAFGGSWAVTYDQQLTVWNLIRHPIDTLKSLVVGKLIPPSLGLTVQAYLLVQPQLDKDTVYFVFTGANDYLNVLRFEDNYNPAVMSTYIDNVLDGLTASVRKLTNAGARHVVVMGLPEIGEVPKFVYTMDRSVLNAAIQQHNIRLATRLAEWTQSNIDVDFLYIDLQPVMQRALDNPAQFGFSNVKDPCIDVKLPMFDSFAKSPFAGNYVLEYQQVLNYRDANFADDEKNYTVCSTPENYLFWDEVHPSTKAHRYLANEICEKMKAHGYQINCITPANS